MLFKKLKATFTVELILQIYILRLLIVVKTDVLRFAIRVFNYILQPKNDTTKTKL